MTNRAFQSFAPCFRASLLRVYEEAKCVTRWSKGCARVREVSRGGVTARWTSPPLPFDCCTVEGSPPRVKRIDAAAPSTLIIISVRHHPIVS